MDTSVELLKQAIEDAASMVMAEQASVLPHPSVTNQYLHQHLAAVSFHPYAAAEPAPARTGDGLKDRARHARDVTKNVAAISPAKQKEFNRSLVQLLHQIEHRTRRQEMEINRLTADITILKAQLRIAEKQANGE